MSATKAHLAGNKAHQKKLDRIIMQPYKEEGAEIRDAAARAGMSVQKYILTAVREYMHSNGGG